MPWILDGNNLARGRSRSVVRRAALAVARQERVRILIFFDGAPPPGVGQAERLGQVEIRYVPNADAAIASLLTGAGRGWRLATDDRRLAAAARQSGAEVVPAAGFWRKADALDVRASGAKLPVIAADEDLSFLSDSTNRLPTGAVRVPRRKPRPRRGEG